MATLIIIKEIIIHNKNIIIHNIKKWDINKQELKEVKLRECI